MNRFLSELERRMPEFLVIEASIWVVTLLDTGTELTPEQAAAMVQRDDAENPAEMRGRARAQAVQCLAALAKIEKALECDDMPGSLLMDVNNLLKV